MKKTTITVALFAVLGTVAVSCQKDNIDETGIVSECNTVYTVNYSIDGVTRQTTLYGDDAWDEFMRNMMALCREGYDVVIRDANAATLGEKEILTYITHSASDAQSWCETKYKEGYSVEMHYDADKDEYTCIAIR